LATCQAKHHIVVGLRAAFEDELRLIGRLVVDGAEIVAGKRYNKLSLPHDTLKFRSPPIHWQKYSKEKPVWAYSRNALGPRIREIPFRVAIGVLCG
jgi:hypothetical protein